MKRVYVTRELPEPALKPLRNLFETEVWDGNEPIPPGHLSEVLEDVNGLLCMLTDEIDANLLGRAPRLEVISQMAVGVDNIDVDECHRLGIPVGHTPGVLTETVADTAFALLASIVRRLPEGARIVRSGEWGPWSPTFLNGRDLNGTTLGVIGMGRIGRAVSRRCLGFDMEVVYTSRSPAPEVSAERLELPELLDKADHVVICVSFNPETHHLIGRAELDMMKESAYLVNVSRGPVVDTDALVGALEAGAIAGAALDVTDPEPLPPDHPLLRFDNCLVVPHIASSSLRTREAMAGLAVENLVAGLEGRKMPASFSRDPNEESD